MEITALLNGNFMVSILYLERLVMSCLTAPLVGYSVVYGMGNGMLRAKEGSNDAELRPYFIGAHVAVGVLNAIEAAGRCIPELGELRNQGFVDAQRAFGDV
jgi:hypothetical protein